jgi:hypothetical protein
MSETLNNPPKPHKIAASAVPAPARFSSWRDHFARERRWLAETFSAEKMIDMLKQLAWVVPLTLLIWIYAEREQIATLPNETIPFQLVSPDPGNMAVELMPKQQDSNVVVELQGPRARLQNVLQRLRGGTQLQGLRLEIDRNLAPGEHTLPTSQLVGNNPIFTQNGITVTRTQPERLHVLVDPIVDREARVLPPPGVTTLDPATRFEPPTVKLRGPATLLDRAKNEAGGTLSVYARIPDELLRTPGEKDAHKLALELPQSLSEERVTLLRQDVEGTLHVRASDTTYEMPAMTVSLDQPKSVSDKYVVDYTTSLPSVTLIGPKDKIDQVSDPNYQQKPYAQLRVTSADVGKEGLKRRLRFVDLPPGVRVSEKDEQREIAFTVKPKSDGEQ